ncbi:unnamed protein product [Rodentolepis nana]|uniref:Bee-milk protein n=1 Tax=Rodentolepis nana TaxID=102285 RepID=A0A0R3TE77_RODNA|nr:unnamed protein product [Rodentolepis nana]
MNSKLFLSITVLSFLLILESCSATAKKGNEGFKMMYPIFRFYFPPSNAYITGANNSNELVVQERNPFRLNVEWEWISKSRHGGLFLRNLDTQEYLCFDKIGKPVVQKELNFNGCLLVVSMAPLKMFGGKKVSYPKGVGPVYPPPWPVLIRPARAKQRVWRLGFCSNGHPFINGTPAKGACPVWILPRWWSILIMCPVIPDRCWTAACMSTSLTYGKRLRCPQECLNQIHCLDAMKTNSALSNLLPESGK